MGHRVVRTFTIALGNSVCGMVLMLNVESSLDLNVILVAVEIVQILLGSLQNSVFAVSFRALRRPAFERGSFFSVAFLSAICCLYS